MPLNLALISVALLRQDLLKNTESVLTDWCSAGMNGEMSYLGQNIEKRIDPGILVPGAKSVIVTGINYYTEKKQGGNGVPVISRYAYGDNYHDVIKAKLNKILDFIKIISLKLKEDHLSILLLFLKKHGEGKQVLAGREKIQF